MAKRAIVTDAQGAPQRTPGASRKPTPLAGAQFVGAAAGEGQLPTSGVAEVAFAGRSNSGKSSAINALAGRHRLAFTSRTPGRTQQINFFALRSGALVADLPGYGYAAVPRALKQSWQDFLWQYVTQRDTLVGLVIMIDARHGVRPPDLELLDAFVSSGRPVLVLATKCDKLNTAERRKAVRAIETALRDAFPSHPADLAVIAFSATTREGVERANEIIAGWLPGAG